MNKIEGSPKLFLQFFRLFFLFVFLSTCHRQGCVGLFDKFTTQPGTKQSFYLKLFLFPSFLF